MYSSHSTNTAVVPFGSSDGGGGGGGGGGGEKDGVGWGGSQT